MIFSGHVRGWNYDGGSLTPLSGVNFIAYDGTKNGVQVGTGDVDADGVDEILTMPGADAAIGAQLRAWNVDGGTASAVTGIDFDAYADATVIKGGTVAGGNLD